MQTDAEDEIFINEGWRRFDTKKEALRIDELPPNDAFLDCNLRKDSTLLSIFTHFVTDHIMDTLMSNFDTDKLVMKKRKHTNTFQHMRLKMTDMYQALAVQIRIIGLQVHTHENTHNVNPLQARVKEAIEHCRNNLQLPCASRDTIEKLLANMLLTEEYVDELSDNFQSVIRHLGQYVAGDEKLFHFTGESGNVRLVISKPDKVGLWFYELCAPLRSGLPYLLDLRMHNSQVNSVPVNSIVQRWNQVVRGVGSEHVQQGQHPNPKCYLSFDSYYFDSAVKLAVQGDPHMKVCCSVKPDRMKTAVRAITGNGNNIDKAGDTLAMYNPTTSESFVAHHDTQKGVGKKYNYSKGFVHDTRKETVKNHQHRIPAYSYYKAFFECCDNFNRALHDKSWPHKRGGRGKSGEEGCHNDFLMAVVLQNTFHLYHDRNGTDPKTVNFMDLCVALSDQLFSYSQNYNVV